MFIKDHPIELLKDLVPLSANMLIKHGRKVIPTVFFVRGFHREDVLEEHKATPGYDFTKWDEWLQAGRIFINKPLEI